VDLAVAHFMASSTPCTSAAAFMEANPRLLDSKIMLTHYSVELLFSPAARRSFVAARHPVHPGARMT
jgi:hypothetical protein